MATAHYLTHVEPIRVEPHPVGAAHSSAAQALSCAGRRILCTGNGPLSQSAAAAGEVAAAAAAEGPTTTTTAPN